MRQAEPSGHDACPSLVKENGCEDRKVGWKRLSWVECNSKDVYKGHQEVMVLEPLMEGIWLALGSQSCSVIVWGWG